MQLSFYPAQDSSVLHMLTNAQNLKQMKQTSFDTFQNYS